MNIKAYTPEEVAEMLQLNKNTIYELISRGEIIAKRLGKVYRISPASLSYVFTGLDYDLYTKEQEDIKNLANTQEVLREVRAQL